MEPEIQSNQAHQPACQEPPASLVGCEVVVAGTSRDDLNDAEGKVVDYLRHRARFVVALEGQQDLRLSLKGKNLRKLPQSVRYAMLCRWRYVPPLTALLPR